MIREHYARRGLGRIELTPARLKMARMPMGAEPVVNDVGTAPGVRVASGRTTIFCLPGVPVEMRGIFRRSAEPEIRAKLGTVHRKYITLKLEGVLESALAPILVQELRRHPGAYIKSHPRGIKDGISRIELDIAVVGEDESWTEEEGETIARDMGKAVELAGGNVKPAKGAKG
jgi:molybdopterin-biosynthesis enzyme MoeA-like protein